MQNQTIAGIDVSCATLDICVSTAHGQHSFVINNNVKAITRFFRSYQQPLIIGMENTGLYNWALYEVLKDLPQHQVYVISPLHLNKSLGLVRGNNYKIDAVRIAAFILKHYTDLTQWKPLIPVIQKLKNTAYRKAQPH